MSDCGADVVMGNGAEKDCDEHGVWVCSFCELRVRECLCNDETPWAQNRIVRKMEWFFYNNPIPWMPSAFVNYSADLGRVVVTPDEAG